MEAIKPKRSKKDYLDPRQSEFLALYLDPKSELRGNALQSALKAGYTREYAESITAKMPDWLADNVGQDKMLTKAEKNLDEFLDLDPWIEHTNKDGETYTKYNVETLKVKADVTKFVAGTIGRFKNKGEGEGNKTLIINITGETAARYGLLKQPE